MTLPTVVFITALPCEFKAVFHYITNSQEQQHAQGTIYQVGEYPTEDPHWQVAIVETGQNNTVAALETERAVEHFNPEYVFFVGIAGGIKDVALGDVVIAETVKGYERGKITDERILPRGEVGKSDYSLTERAKAIARTQEWCASLQREKLPQVVVPATITAGEKVINSTQHMIYQFLIDNYSDAIAVEMEGIGFLEAIRHCHSRGIVIRGISDLLAKSEQHDKKWQPIASENAAAFAFAMLDKLSSSYEIQKDLEELANANSQKDILLATSKLIKELSKSITIIEQQKKLQEKANELGKLVDYLERLNSIKADFPVWEEAEKWLRSNQENLVNVAIQKCLNLNEYAELKNPGRELDSSKKVEEFRQNVSNYISWLLKCLEKKSDRIPCYELPVIFNKALYKCVFTHMKEVTQNSKPLSNIAKVVIIERLDTLINKF